MMAKIEISGADWDMSDWEAADIVVDGIVMALEGCGGDDDPVTVISESGEVLRVLGIRRTGSGAEIVVGKAAR
jgi:hypothetical protein